MSDSILDQFLEHGGQLTNEWHRLGLLENPFPARSHPVWGVFHNQQQVVERFYGDLAEFLQSGKTLTLFFTGGNRIGKTHFCEYHRLRLPGQLAARGLLLPIAVLSAESCKFSEVYRPLIDQLDESLRAQTGDGLFSERWMERLDRIRDVLPPGDFRNAVIKLGDAGDDDRAWFRSTFLQWLRGNRILPSYRRHLGVGSVIESLGHQLDALSGLRLALTAVYEDEPRCPGMLVFVDEFELIWTHRRDRRDRFLQALRALIDACPTGLYLCVAMATGLNLYETDQLESEYPALFARLKGARDLPALVEVAGVLEAQEYAQAFLEYGRKKAQEQGIESGPPLLSEEEIRKLFIGVAGAGGSASQGDFFDRLHLAAREKAGLSS